MVQVVVLAIPVVNTSWWGGGGGGVVCCFLGGGGRGNIGFLKAFVWEKNIWGMGLCSFVVCYYYNCFAPFSSFFC